MNVDRRLLHCIAAPLRRAALSFVYPHCLLAIHCRRKLEVQSRQSEREEGIAQEIRRADTPIDKLSFSMWNSLVPDQEPTCVRRHKHLQQSVQREDQEAIFDPECLDRDPFMIMARKGPGHRSRHNPVAGGILHHPSGTGRKAEDRPRRSSTPLPEKPHRLPRAVTPGWEGAEVAPGQRGTSGSLLWRVSGQANNLKKNADTEYWDHYSRYASSFLDKRARGWFGFGLRARACVERLSCHCAMDCCSNTTWSAQVHENEARRSCLQSSPRAQSMNRAHGAKCEEFPDTRQVQRRQLGPRLQGQLMARLRVVHVVSYYEGRSE